MNPQQIENHIYPWLNDFALFERRLKQLPFNRLPGLDAQLKMAPLVRREEISSRGSGKSPVKSSVLLLFFPIENKEVGTVFIQRPVYQGTHSGQISFPGGRYEKTDPDMLYTALRETFEEIGVNPKQVEVVGRLSELFIPPSNYIVTPFLGIVSSRPYFIADPNEVARVLEMDFKAFFRAENCTTKTITPSTGFSLQAPCFTINGHIIWGATAMIISELLELLQMDPQQ